MINLSKLEEISDLRKVWPHEAQDFTPWLASEDNIGSLSDAIGIDIAIDEEESPVGDFSVDILAREVDTGRKIIIENQLESTNHDHLGKLITYASGKSADIIVWVVKHAREEHRSAIEWLNIHTDESVAKSSSTKSAIHHLQSNLRSSSALMTGLKMLKRLLRPAQCSSVGMIIG